jgi:hypothetical protein
MPRHHPALTPADRPERDHLVALLSQSRAWNCAAEIARAAPVITRRWLNPGGEGGVISSAKSLRSFSMGGQPGKPKPPGNPPIRPEPQEPKPIEEPPRPIPLPPVERPPAPIRAR